MRRHLICVGPSIGVIGGLLVSAAALSAGSDIALLVRAVNSGDRAAVRALLPRVDVNQAEADGTTAMHWAVRRDDEELVQLLILAGAKATAANRYGVTPLALAATNGNAAMVERLIRAGADPNAALPNGETILMAAARTGDVDTLKRLIAHGAGVNARERVQGQTALMLAAAADNAAAVRELAAAGADLNAQSVELDYPLFKWTLNGMVSTTLPRGRWTALMFAARQNAFEAAQALADAGADLNLQDGEGATALVLAIINVHFDLAAMLLENGADPNISDETGMAALYATIDMHSLSSMLSRASPELVDKITPIDMVKLLLERRADPNARLRKPILGRHHGAGDTSLGEGATPLMRAAKSHDHAAMQLLLEAGADPAATQKDFTNALMLAAGGRAGRGGAYSIPPFRVTRETEVETIKLLLEQGVDINAFNVLGMTALHFAARRGADPVVQFLADRGAILDIKNRRGHLPLDLSLGAAGGRRGPEDGEVFESTAALLRQLMASAGDKDVSKQPR